ncbi:hypothetical protein ACOMHN_042416 [Nucella lapillus]
MASASAPASHLECPVCHDGFTEPKLLPCTHLVCRKCVVSWLEKGGDQNGCPLCRAPIVPDSAKAQGDFASQVDALPTDFATAAVIESAKMLNSGHVCSCCDDVEASVFCLQCAVKLCDACAKPHVKLPSSRDHVTKKLSDLSAKQLALHHHVPCINHQEKQAELYCSNHEQVICVLCFSSTHNKCGEVEGMGEEVAQRKREELRAKLKKLEQRKAAITEKINKLDIQESNAKTTFKAMKNEVKATFDDLRRSLDVQERNLNSQIQQREETYLANRKSLKLDLENNMAAVSAHKSTAERVVSAAPDSALLGMLGKLKSRLDALESRVLPEVPEMAVGRLVLDQDTVRKTKEALAAIGRLTDPSTAQQGTKNGQCLWRGQGLEGPAYAAVIKVGDRVRRGRDWHRDWEINLFCASAVSQDGSPPGVGTVTGVAADLKTGGVFVKWDCGNKTKLPIDCPYLMGYKNQYQLKFAPNE